MLQINPNFFNKKTGKLKNVDNYEVGTELNETMERLRGYIISSYNNANIDANICDKHWFEGVLNTFFNRVGKNNLEYLVEYAYSYIKKMPIKTNKNGTIGCAKGTIVRYISMIRKLDSFEKARKRKYKITDVGLTFRDDYLKFLVNELNHGENTAGRYINFVKTICLDAKRNEIKVHPQLESVRGFIKKQLKSL